MLKHTPESIITGNFLKEGGSVKVILQQDIRGQGKKGELKEVSDGYARNYLIPRGLAVEATTNSLNAMKLQEKARQKQIEKEKEEALENAELLKGILVTIHAKSGGAGRLFGSITTKEISEELKKQHDMVIEKNKIVQAEPIKNYGTYELKVRLGHEVTGTLTVSIVEA